MINSKYYKIFNLLRDTIVNFNKERAYQYGAALSYYMLFSIVPMLVVVIQFFGLVFGQETVEASLLSYFSDSFGSGNQDYLSSTIHRLTDLSEFSWIEKTIGICVLIFTSTGVFYSIETSVSKLWHLKEGKKKKKKAIVKPLLSRIKSFSMLLITGLIILLTFFLESISASALDVIFEYNDSIERSLVFLTHLVLGVLLSSISFILIFKFLVPAKINWKVTLIGAIVTAIIFELGSLLIGYYLNSSNITAVYGFMGSIMIILAWVFYSSQIIFLGAKFTYELGKYLQMPIKSKL